jgi:hypothetical protein
MPRTKASVTQHNVDVEVSLDECLRIVEERAWASLGRRPPSSHHGGSLTINTRTGLWESWTNTHGSGFTEDMGAATTDELAMNSLFNDLHTAVRRPQRDIVSVKK